MIFNIIYGKAAFATINASTQYSSSFTCSDGTITLSASGTSVSFVVPKSGTWTVTCTYGGVTKSNNVSVTTYGGTYSTSFTFTKYLYHDGTQDVAWSGFTFASDYMTPLANQKTCTSAVVDLTGYSSIVVQYTLSSVPSLGVLGYAASTSYSSFESQVKFTTKQSSKATISLDVSSVNSSKCIGFIGMASNGFNVYQVYLTP